MVNVDPADRVDYLQYLARAGFAHINAKITGKSMTLSARTQSQSQSSVTPPPSVSVFTIPATESSVDVTDMSSTDLSVPCDADITICIMPPVGGSSTTIDWTIGDIGADQKDNYGSPSDMSEGFVRPSSPRGMYEVR